MTTPLILGITGASGLIYAVRALKFLLEADYAIELVASKSAYMVWQAEQDIRMPPEPDQQEQFWRQQAGVPTGGRLICHRWSDVGANIASGSFRTLGMMILPCSMSTVAKIAAGLSSDLLERAADVQLKEGRPLIVVPRETPFSLIHLRNPSPRATRDVRPQVRLARALLAQPPRFPDTARLPTESRRLTAKTSEETPWFAPPARCYPSERGRPTSG